MSSFKYAVPLLLLWCLGALSLTGIGCGEIDWREDDWNQAGRNENEVAPGNAVRGQLLDEQVVIDNEGRFVIFVTSDTKTYALDLQDGTGHWLDIPLHPQRVAFTKDNRAIFLSWPACMFESNGSWITMDDSIYANCNDGDQNVLTIVDLPSGSVLKKYVVPVRDSYLSINESGTEVICWGERDTSVRVDMETFESQTYEFSDYIYDFVWSAATSEWVVVHHYPFDGDEWKCFPVSDQDSARIGSKLSFFSSKNPKKIKKLLVPNCAASIEISPDGALGMLAPTWCHSSFSGADPVSIINLESHSYIETVPGFGPVDFAPSGEYALAFGRKNTLNDMTGILTDTLYSLMFLYPETRHTDIVNLGEILPLYTITPDSRSVLIYSKESIETGIWVVDAETKILSKVDGPNLSLSKYVMGTTNEITYLADDGLYLLDAEAATLDFVPVDCLFWLPGRISCNPNRIGILPDRTRLILGYDDPMDFLIYDIADQAIVEAYRVESDGTSL